MTRFVAAAIALAICAPAFAADPPRTVTIARMDSALDDAQMIGARRAGLMCLPNGTIRWGDVGTGTAMDQRAIVQDAFEDAGAPVTPLGIGSAWTARLRGTVRAATFSLCARHYLGGHRGDLSGDATLRVEWRLESAAGGPVQDHVSEVSRTFDGAQAAPLGALYRRMLTDAARDAAAWLKGQ